MEAKKKRGCNYTAAEKEFLLELIIKYKKIIENKDTNARMISKKRETWGFVCQRYNAVAVSGARTWQQLRHLYENLKQRSKKRKCNHLQFYEKHKEIEKKASVDKDEINCTDGAFKNTLAEQDAHVLTPEIQPLSNPNDETALYFGDIAEETKIKTEDSEVMIITTDDTVQQKATAINNQEDNQPEMSSTTSTNIYQECTQPQTSSSYKNNCVNLKQKGSNTKQQYFIQKLRNAKLEHKYLLNKIRMDRNKYKLEMKILKLKLQKLQSRSTY